MPLVCNERQPYRSELETEPLRSTYWYLPYEPQYGGMFGNYVMCEINNFFNSVVCVRMKQNDMRYIFNRVCVTYSIMFINSRCNKTT